MARGLKFRIKKVEGSYYLSSENKGADQLRGYREADLRLCFRICFLTTRLMYIYIVITANCFGSKYSDFVSVFAQGPVLKIKVLVSE